MVPADSRAVDVHPSANLVADRGGEGPLSADAVHTLEETSRGRHDVVDVSFLLQFYKQPDTIARIAARCGTETLTPIQSTVLASRLSTCSPYFHLCISCSVRELPIATWVMPFQLNAVTFYARQSYVRAVARGGGCSVHACGAEHPSVVIEFVVNVDSVDERDAWHAAVVDSPIADFLVFAPDLHEVWHEYSRAWG